MSGTVFGSDEERRQKVAAEVAEVFNEHIGDAERMLRIIEIAQRAYDEGWQDCDEQWTQHVHQIGGARA